MDVDVGRVQTQDHFVQETDVCAAALLEGGDQLEARTGHQSVCTASPDEVDVGAEVDDGRAGHSAGLRGGRNRTWRHGERSEIQSCSIKARQNEVVVKEKTYNNTREDRNIFTI